jgi:thiamine monophosphate synthase
MASWGIALSYWRIEIGSKSEEASYAAVVHISKTSTKDMPAQPGG